MSRISPDKRDAKLLVPIDYPSLSRACIGRVLIRNQVSVSTGRKKEASSNKLNLRKLPINQKQEFLLDSGKYGATELRCITDLICSQYGVHASLTGSRDETKEGSQLIYDETGITRQ